MARVLYGELWLTVSSWSWGTGLEGTVAALHGGRSSASGNGGQHPLVSLRIEELSTYAEYRVQENTEEVWVTTEPCLGH